MFVFWSQQRRCPAATHMSLCNFRAFGSPVMMLLFVVVTLGDIGDNVYPHLQPSDEHFQTLDTRLPQVLCAKPAVSAISHVNNRMHRMPWLKWRYQLPAHLEHGLCGMNQWNANATITH